MGIFDSIKNIMTIPEEDEIDNENEVVEEVVEKMRQNLAQILSREKNIELRELCLLGFDRSSAFIALLFLAREGDYNLFQDEFYGKLFVEITPFEQKTQEEEEI